MTSWHAILAVLVVLFASSPLHAQPADEAKRLAAESFRQAQEAFARREYAAAAAAFEQADRLAPHAQPLLNAAEAWALANEPVRAAEICERLLGRTPLDESHRAEAEQRLAKLGTKLARLDLTGADTLRVRLDGGAEFRMPAKRWVAPGKHALLVTNADASATHEQDVEAVAGDRKALELAVAQDKPPEAKPVAPPPQPAGPVPDPATTQGDEGGVPTATWICFGVAGAAAVVMAVFGAMTLSAQSDFEAQPTQDAADDFNRNKLITNIALGVAAAGAVTGAIVWIVSATTSNDEVALQLAPRADGLSAGLRVRY